MNNYKIKVNDEAESKEAQELFFGLGYRWKMNNPKQITKDCFGIQARLDCGKPVLYALPEKYFNACEYIELTLPQLRDLVAQNQSSEQGLISWADALRALADGKEVEYSVNNSDWELFAESKVFCPGAILSGINQNSQALSFRIKPSTINILGVELNKEDALRFVEEYFS